MNNEIIVAILSLINKTETMSKYGSVTNRSLCGGSDFINRYKATDASIISVALYKGKL